MAIEHISDTARWVAIYRGMETARPDAIFRDPFAMRLAGAKGLEIVETIPGGKRMAWAMIVRTAAMDEMILDRIRAGADTVINLAAGLDARPWRMDLPKSLKWIDVDLPGILDHKVRELADEPTRCQYEAVMLDLTDAQAREQLFERLGRETKNAIVVTEGLIVYLDPDEVGRLATALHRQASFRWWISDLASPQLLKMVQRSWGTQLERGRAPFKFAPENGTKFFEPFGWRELQFRRIGDDAQRFNREMKGMWFWRLVMRLYPKRIREQFRGLSANILLEHAE